MDFIRFRNRGEETVDSVFCGRCPQFGCHVLCRADQFDVPIVSLRKEAVYAGQLFLARNA